jgi:hypothetical protein
MALHVFIYLLWLVCSEAEKVAKTYNSGYSLVVTHLTTNPPVRCLNRAERTGSLVFNVLWSYVKILQKSWYINYQLFVRIQLCFECLTPCVTSNACNSPFTCQIRILNDV